MSNKYMKDLLLHHPWVENHQVNTCISDSSHKFFSIRKLFISSVYNPILKYPPKLSECSAKSDSEHSHNQTKLLWNLVLT